jgi:hypothetical protein
MGSPQSCGIYPGLHEQSRAYRTYNLNPSVVAIEASIEVYAIYTNIVTNARINMYFVRRAILFSE